MLSLGDHDGLRTAWASVLTCIPLIGVSLVPQALGMTGWGYSVVALVLGLAFLLFALLFVQSRSNQRARWLFLYSLAYLPTLLVVLVVDTLTDWI